MFDESLTMKFKKNLNLWPFYFTKLRPNPAKYAYFAVISRNEMTIETELFFLISLLNFHQTCVLIYKDKIKNRKLNF